MNNSTIQQEIISQPVKLENNDIWYSKIWTNSITIITFLIFLVSVLLYLLWRSHWEKNKPTY